MPLLLLILLVVSAVFGPQLWAKHVLAKHGGRRDDLPGTGSELARHLIEGLQLGDVRVEPTDAGSHYDPTAKRIRLNTKDAHPRSLTSLVTACHEVGHVIQDASGYPPFRARSRMVMGGQIVQKIGAGLMMATPLIALLTHSPRVGLLMLLGGLATLGSTVLVHLVTLPVEWDASFRRALPLLAANNWIQPRDQRAAREILTACALTYVAASLASLLNLGRWLAILRR